MSQIEQPLFCSQCQVTFKNKYNMNVHMKNIHKQVIPATTNQECAICHLKLKTIYDLHKHIETCHPDVSLNFLSTSFYCDEDYMQWKTEMEKNTASQFTQRSGIKKCEDKTIQYVHCHRSGNAKLKSTGKRRLKSGGTIKTGVTCPAFMKVTRTQVEEAIEISVELQSTHIGHEMEVEKLRLTNEERTRLAEMLSQGIPTPTILSHVRSQYSPTKRLGLTRRQDLSNIVRDFNLPRLPKKDATSVNKMHLICQKNNLFSEGIMKTEDEAELVISEDTIRQRTLSKLVKKRVSGKSDTDLDKRFKKIAADWQQILVALQNNKTEETISFVEDILKNLETFISLPQNTLILPSTSDDTNRAPQHTNIVPRLRMPQRPRKKLKLVNNKTATCA